MAMSLVVKICGMTNEADVAAAVKAGADALGFILYEKSPRFVAPDRVVELLRAVPPGVLKVAVVVDLQVSEILRLSGLLDIDIWQLHGDETAAYTEELAPLHLWKAVGLPGVEPEALAGHRIEAVLLDKASPRKGGTGETFDWALAAAFKQGQSRPIVLSGGLRPENVVQGIRTVQPWGVDVCSGVEARPGVKDHAKLNAFIDACRQA
jgi:phosphoribosylanthranilate isomerase